MSETLIEIHRKILGISTPIHRSSKLGVTTMKSQRLVDICQGLGADTYLSGSGARDYIDENTFKIAGIKLIYQDFHHPNYSQAYPGFEPYLASLDLILNSGPKSSDILMGQ